LGPWAELSLNAVSNEAWKTSWICTSRKFELKGNGGDDPFDAEWSRLLGASLFD